MSDLDFIWNSPSPPAKVASPPRPPRPAKKRTYVAKGIHHPDITSWPASTASSRDFVAQLPLLPRDTAPKPAKARKLGFLDFPETVRKQIYELAIYDHDRTAVFLPRALPRKVVPGLDDVDVECTACIEGSSHYFERIPAVPLSYVLAAWGLPCDIQSTSDDDGLARGVWTDDHDPLMGAYHSLKYVHTLTQLDDREILKVLEVESDSEDEGSDRVLDSDMCIDPKQEISDHDELLARAGLMGYAETVGDSEDEGSDEDSLTESELPTSDFEVDSHSDQEITPLCETGACEDPNCLKCCEHPSHLREYSEDADKNVFHEGDNIDLDDEDHFDSTEQIGMLYEPQEPAILLVSRQVRSECLPIYFGQNAFSWRFQWADYQDSCFRFKS